MKSKKLILGVGVNDSNYVTQPTVNGKTVLCEYYRTWMSMLQRCYSAKCHEKQPTYIGCTVVNEWLSFMEFRSWMILQDWQGKQLDKDIIIPNNKVYGPDFCVFVSHEINLLLTDRAEARGDFPLGVSRNGKLFRARCHIYGEQKHLGTFKTPEEASDVYREFKSSHIRDVAYQQSDLRVRGGLIRHAEL